MLVYFALIIPILAAIVCYVFFKHKTEWWEITIPVVVSLIFILVAKWICVNSLTSDEEWLGGYVVDVRYYEPWDEEVPCRHPIYCSRVVCSGSGKTRSCHTQSYVCGHVHAYDVDYHPERWEAVTTLGSYSITREKYNQLIHKFGTPQVLVELNRRYHRIDGDMFRTDWPNTDPTLEPVAKSETYENRPKASHSIYHFEPVDTTDLKRYKPFEYPPITSPFTQKTLLGIEDAAAHHKLQVINARLGAKKEVRVYVLVFNDEDSRTAGDIQQRYWEGGNKNEIVVCIGLNREKQVSWGYVFSWTEKSGVWVNIRNEIESQTDLDLMKIMDKIEMEINTEWVRRDFHDFDYLTIEPTPTQLLIIYILTILICGGICWWIVANEFDNSTHDQYRGRPTRPSITEQIKRFKR